MMNILHIIPDDKFWQPVIETFEATKYNNYYISIVEDTKEKYQYIADARIKMVKFTNVATFLEDKEIDVYVFHSLPYTMYDVILSINDKKTIIVSSWGFDIYYPQGKCKPIIKIDLYKRHTEHFIKSQIKHKDSMWMLLKHKVKMFILGNDEIEKKIDIEKQKKVLNKINYWATVLPYEYNILKKQRYIRAEYFPFFYTTWVSQNIDLPLKKNANYILVGNSADPSNNHMDVLKIIQKKCIKNRMYIPLAYGNAAYKEQIVHYINENHLNCIVQNDFLSKDVYEEVLLKCGVGIFGHIRQQALGNIYMIMRNGGKIFLYKDSIVYKYLKSIGGIVYSIENELTQSEIDKPLSSIEIERNIQIVNNVAKDVFFPKMEETLHKISESYE